MSVPTIPQDVAPLQMPATNDTAPEPIANPAMMWTFDPTSLDADFWNPNILSTSNWLDAVVDPGFSDFPLDMGFQQDHSTQFTPYGNLGQLPQATPTSLDMQPHLDPHKQLPEQTSPAGLVSMASGQSGASTESAAEACASADDTPTRAGEYYVDGQPARLPRTKRRKLSSVGTNRLVGTTTGKNFTLHNPLSTSADLSHRIAIPTETYEMFDAAYQATCSTAGPWTPFDHAGFPPQELFEHLVSLYFSSFYSKCCGFKQC